MQQTNTITQNNLNHKLSISQMIWLQLQWHISIPQDQIHKQKPLSECNKVYPPMVYAYVK